MDKKIKPFVLSDRSKQKLLGVNNQLVQIVEKAIYYTTVDFGVVEGLRSEDEQRVLFAKGASQTMKSKHITGRAVDLMAYANGRGCWEIQFYYPIAEAMKQAATELNVPIRWGGAWNVPDICKWQGSMESALNFYVDERRRMAQKLFIDAPHFELSNN